MRLNGGTVLGPPRMTVQLTLPTAFEGLGLDRVLGGAADESLVAAEGCGEAEEGQVVAGVAFVAVVESAVAGQSGHGPFSDPSSAP